MKKVLRIERLKQKISLIGKQRTYRIDDNIVKKRAQYNKQYKYYKLY